VYVFQNIQRISKSSTNFFVLRKHHRNFSLQFIHCENKILKLLLKNELDLD
jgi:hypothetical protein